MIPFKYDSSGPLAFLGPILDPPTFTDARVVVLPVPFERTTSYIPGTRFGPREILIASAQVELWDEEVKADIHDVGIYTLAELDLPVGDFREALLAIRSVVGEIAAHEKFIVMLGGEHSITPPAVAALAERHPGLTVLQLDAHADLREEYQGSRDNHACAMRRVLEHARAVQVGVRSLSPEEALAAPTLPTSLFLDVELREDPFWIERVVNALGDPVYVTIDCDAFDPALMPAVGTPEPGGLSWRETTGLLREVFRHRQVVGFDVVELCPLPGQVAPNFIMARLIYKLLSYRFARSAGAGSAR